MLRDATRLAPAVADDMAALAALRRAAIGAQADGPYNAAQLALWMEHPLDRLAAALAGGGDDVALVAWGLEGPVGFAWATPGQRPHLRSLYVAPAVAGLGIGTRLLAAVESELRRRGASALWVAATLNAVAFYRRRGFEPVKPFSWRPPTAPDGGAVLPLWGMRKALDV
jgi:GNAT superfamily N-acetyltransferase